MLQHIISSASWRLQANFWLIWSIVTVSAAWLMTVCLYRCGALEIASSPSNKGFGNWRNLRISDSLKSAAFLLFLLGYIALLLYKEDFVYYDYSLLTESTLSGIKKRPTIIPAFGRFYPLAFQEFNLLSFVTNTAIGYQLFSVFQLVLSVGILFRLQERYSVLARLIVAAVILITPSIVVSFGGLIYPERNVVFWLLIFLIFKRLYYTRPSVLWGVGSVVAAQFMIYYKETAFLLVFGTSVLVIFTRMLNGLNGRYELKKLSDPQSMLDVILLCLVILFLGYYFIIMLRSGVSQKYVDDAKLPFFQNIVLYLKSDLLLPILVATLFGRVICIFRDPKRLDPYWDGCGLAALLYMSSYAVLRLFSSYYMAPVDVLTLLYVGRWIIPSWHGLSTTKQIMVCGLSVMLLSQMLVFSNMKIVERKNFLVAQVEVADFLMAEHERSGERALHLFFPFSVRYARQEFASYLRYRGLEPERNIPENRQTSNVFLSSPVDPREDRRCMPWFNYVCRQQGEPISGDLVVILPDDGVSFEEINRYMGGLEPAFVFQPIPRSPDLFVALARLLRPLQPNLPFRSNVEIRDTWLHAFVYRWP